MNKRIFIALAFIAAANLTGCASLSGSGAEAKPRISVIGATARSGRVIIRQALDAGYDVVGLARTPSKLGFEHPNLTLVKGDVRDAESLRAAIGKGDIVICMVGKAPPSDPLAPIGKVDLYTVMGANLIKVMQEEGAPRLIMASSTGVEHRVDPNSTEPAGKTIPDAWRFSARYLYNDMWEMENMIAASGLEYVLLRPGFMVDGEARNDIKVALDDNTPPGRTLTYEDFAAFTLAQATGDEYLGKRVGMYTDTRMDAAAELRKFLEQQKKQQEAGGGADHGHGDGAEHQH